MSMYNKIFGVCEGAGMFLHMLGLRTHGVGRFRDCFLTDVDCDGNKLKAVSVCVYTRNGGGNRTDYQDILNALKKHPNHLFDRDDSFDSTYCSIYFSIPEKYKSLIEDLAAACPEVIRSQSPQQRFLNMLDGLHQGIEDNRDVKQALEVGKEVIAKLAEAIKNEKSGIIKV